MAGLGSYMSRVVRAFLSGVHFALFLVLSAAASVPAEAQPSQNWTRCVSKGSPDVVIAGCTAVIHSGKEPRSNLAIGYHNRGNAYSAKSESNRAIADFTKAIEFEPKYAVRNRGATYRVMKNLIRSDPTFTFYDGRAAADWAKEPDAVSFFCRSIRPVLPNPAPPDAQDGVKDWFTA
jgi:tetratricopeptide (TPR) repeat protein